MIHNIELSLLVRESSLVFWEFFWGDLSFFLLLLTLPFHPFYNLFIPLPLLSLSPFFKSFHHKDLLLCLIMPRSEGQQLMDEGVSLEDCQDHIEDVHKRQIIGKVTSNQIFNVMGVNSMVRKAWKTRKSFAVHPWGPNIFVFKFEDENDVSKILKGPWSISNNLISIQRWNPDNVLAEIDFSHVSFWIQFHNLPLSKKSKANVKSVVELFGVLEEYDCEDELNPSRRNFVRVGDRININQPLQRGFNLKRLTPFNLDSIQVWEAYKSVL